MTDQSRSGGAEVEIPGYVTEDLDESLVVSLVGTNLDGANNVAAYLSRFAHADSDKTDPREFDRDVEIMSTLIGGSA